MYPARVRTLAVVMQDHIVKIILQYSIKTTDHIGTGLCEVVDVVCQVQAHPHKMWTCSMAGIKVTKSVYYYSVVNGLDNSNTCCPVSGQIKAIQCSVYMA